MITLNAGFEGQLWCARRTDLAAPGLRVIFQTFVAIFCAKFFGDLGFCGATNNCHLRSYEKFM